MTQSIIKEIKRKSMRKVELKLQPKAYYTCQCCKYVFYSCVLKQEQLQLQQSLEYKNNKIYLIPPSGAIYHVRIQGNQSSWTLKCQNCCTIIGLIHNSQICFYSSEVYKNVIKYLKNEQGSIKKLRTMGQLTPQKQKNVKDENINLKQTKIRKLSNLNDRVYRYLHLAYSSLELKLSKLNLDKIDSSSKQLNSFIKFYKNWTKSQNKMAYQKISSNQIKQQMTNFIQGPFEVTKFTNSKITHN